MIAEDLKAQAPDDTRCPRVINKSAGGQLLITKGMQPWELDKTGFGFTYNKENKEQVFNTI